MDTYCFVAVEFVDDENVKGYVYWYLCGFEGVTAGDKVIAPLGRHNREQQGVVRRVRFESEQNAPYPLHLIKRITRIVKEDESV